MPRGQRRWMPATSNVCPRPVWRCWTTSASTPTPLTSPRSSARLRENIRISSRSEEHTSELQSRLHLVCRLLLEKKKKKKQQISDVKRQTDGLSRHYSAPTPQYDT